MGALTEEVDLPADAKLERIVETTNQWNELMVKAHSVIILSLGDRVLREVSKEVTAVGLWNKLKALYMTKLLANRLYLKKRLYSFSMQSGKILKIIPMSLINLYWIWKILMW